MQIEKTLINDRLHNSEVSRKFHILIIQQFNREVCYFLKKHATF